MRQSAIVLGTVALLALSACSESKVETNKANKGTRVAVEIDGDDASDVTIDGDSETGKFEVSLPGGIEAKVKVPEGMADGAKFDIDGVGLYPGARVGSFKVNASDAKTTKTAIVQIGFTAPGDAAAVADWYQQQFETKRIAVTRTGESLSGKTEDGDDFTVAMNAGPAGGSTGLLTIRDTHKS